MREPAGRPAAEEEPGTFHRASSSTGQPSVIHLSSSARLQRTRLPRRMGRGIAPDAAKRRTWRAEHPRMDATACAPSNAARSSILLSLVVAFMACPPLKGRVRMEKLGRELFRRPAEAADGRIRLWTGVDVAGRWAGITTGYLTGGFFRMIWCLWRSTARRTSRSVRLRSRAYSA